VDDCRIGILCTDKSEISKGELVLKEDKNKTEHQANEWLRI
jgi:hypothetical protein